MAIEFDEIFNVPPIPATKENTVRQVAFFLQRAEESGGIDAVKAGAIDTIYNTRPDDEPSELKRLRLLYQDVYSRAELEKMIDITFADLGLVSD